MYFEFNDVRRIHMPYTDAMIKGKFLLPLLTLATYSAYLEDSTV